jgi:tetratricopeptide (TPR) repeat protein
MIKNNMKNSKTNFLPGLIMNKFKQVFFAGFLVVILVLITYHGAGRNQFVDWDDNDYVTNNPLVKNPGKDNLKDIFTSVVSLNYHPLTILSLSANANKCNTCPGGISPAPFIKWNIIIHIVNSLLVLILIYYLSKGNLLIAFLVAVIFGVHPMHVESVAWISGRKDVLYGFFFLLGLIAYLKFTETKRTKYLWLGAAFILFVFSCLSKATAVVFPVIIILINFWVNTSGKEKTIQQSFKNAISFKNLLILVPFFAVSLFVGLMATNIQSGNNFLGLFKFIKDPHDVINTVQQVSLLQKFQVASYGFVVYILKFIVPINQSTLYPFPTQQELTHTPFAGYLWTALIIVLVLLFLVIRSLRKTKLYFFGLGFYFITVALVLQFVSVGMAIMAERYTYLPYIGLTIIPATLIAESMAKKRKFLLIISGCFIVILIFLSRQQVKVWHDSETLWSQVIKRNPHLAFARSARGKYLYMMSSHAKSASEKKNLEDKALVDFKEAIKGGTRTAEVYEGTGIILFSRGDLKNALEFLNVAIIIDPKKGRTYYNRAMIYDRLNKKEEAIKDYTSALAYSSDLTLEALSNRSVLFLETGKYKEAINDLDKLIALNSKDEKYYVNRGFAKLQLNNIPGAIEDYKIAVKLNPRDNAIREQLQVLLDNQLH